jgi:hypothetical protein
VGEGAGVVTEVEAVTEVLGVLSDGTMVGITVESGEVTGGVLGIPVFWKQPEIETVNMIISNK